MRPSRTTHALFAWLEQREREVMAARRGGRPNKSGWCASPAPHHLHMDSFHPPPPPCLAALLSLITTVPENACVPSPLPRARLLLAAGGGCGRAGVPKDGGLQAGAGRRRGLPRRGRHPRGGPSLARLLWGLGDGGGGGGEKEEELKEGG